MFNVSTTSSSTITTNINASNSAEYVDPNSMKQATRTEIDINDSGNVEMGEIITADDFDMQNDANDQLELESSSMFSDDNDRSVTMNAPPKQGLKQAKDKNAEESVADTSESSTTTTTAPGKELRPPVKQEITDCLAMDIENTSEKRSNGLKVISNVQVSPTAILNVSLNSAVNESNSMNNMIIVRSLPSTSIGSTPSQQQQAQTPQMSKPQSLLKNLNETRTSSETRNSKHTKGNVEVSVIIINIFYK